MQYAGTRTRHRQEQYSDQGGEVKILFPVDPPSQRQPVTAAAVAIRSMLTGPESPVLSSKYRHILITSIPPHLLPEGF
jgi:hypothetical protein